MEPNDKGGGSSQYEISSDDESNPEGSNIGLTLIPQDIVNMEVNDLVDPLALPVVPQELASHPNSSSITAPSYDEIESPSYENLTGSQTAMDTSSNASKVNQTLSLPSSSGTSGTSGTATPRLKAYPPGSKGPFLVFFRPKGKPLNKLQIEKDLAKSFRGIESVDSPSRDKLRVTVTDREQANKIAAYDLFLMEYRVYLPSRELEISGVVTEPFLSSAAIKSGVGGFKNRAVPPVAILDARQMNQVASDGTKHPSNSFCVTFSGSALPDYLVIGKLRLPVRLYKPTVMHCDKCQQIGHTTPFCCNKPRCAKCGEQHVEGACSTEPKCPCCGQAPHELTACPRFIEREKHQIRSLKQRSKKSYAEMLKTIRPTVAPPAQSFNSNNLFTSLPDDEQGSDSEAGEEFSVLQTGTKRKRAIVRRHRQQASHVSVAQQNSRPSLKKSRSEVPPPGFKFKPGDFPSLPGSSKTPDVPVFRPESQKTNTFTARQEHVETSDKITLSGIVEFIFDAMEVSPAIRNLIKMALSFVKPLLKQLASKWPILDSFISFDG